MRHIRKKRKSRNLNLYVLKIISRLLLTIIIVLLVIFVYKLTNYNKKNFVSSLNETTTNIISKENVINNSDNLDIANDNTISKSVTVNMAFTGDIMCHNTIYNDAYISSLEKYDFSYIFDDIKYYLQTPDILIGNLETTFAGREKKYSSYPTFNTPEALAYNLKKLGFDVLSTANNHCYDKGYSGIESTINYLDDADIAHTGTYKSIDEQNTILIKNVKGLKIAFLSYTYGINGISVSYDKSYSVNLIDDDLISNQLTLAKSLNPDLICVSMHWGNEYQTVPNSEQKDLASFLFQNGADIIIGNHPHVLQPMEKRQITLEDGTTKNVFVVYSLGNFIADQNKKYTRDSAILNITITKHNNLVNIDSIKYIPIYTYKDTSKISQKFKIVDLNTMVSSYEAGYNNSIGNKLYDTFSTEIKNIRNLLENNF